MRLLATLALVAGLSSHALAPDGEGAEPGPEDEAPPMAKKAKRKPRAPLA